MTDKEKKQINEFIAVSLFGLVEGKDFGEWEHHDWLTDANGNIDDFGFEYEFHNGPECSRCYHSFCEHCVDDYEEALLEGPCIVNAPDYFSKIDKVLSAFIEKFPDTQMTIEKNKGFQVQVFSTETEEGFVHSEDALSEAVLSAIVGYIKEYA